MVSRRKILSRSRDDLNLDQTFSPPEEEEDIWYQKDKLYKEHIQEVLDKWTQIDDEIWAKVIVFERNRRVAKAYARAPVLTINGSDDGFDGMRIGLCGFDNPMRDQKTEEFKRHIGQGVKIKMDDAGNILIRRYAKSNVYVKSTASNASEETSIGADILKLPNQALESEKIVKLFDMKKFQSNVNRELRRAYPDRRRLETQCLSAVAFVKSESDILECPIWVLIVNVVAMDMLKSKLPLVQRPMVDIKNRPRIPIPDEDPYSVAGNGSGGSSGSSGFGAGSNGHHHQPPQSQQQPQSNGTNGSMHLNGGSNGSSGGHVAATREQLLLQTQQLAHKRSEKPPKLPPRDNIYAHDIIPKPDYDDIEVDTRIKLSRGKSDKGKDNKKYDDPYYCGLRARVPNFVKSSKPSKDHKDGGGNSHPNSIVSTNGVSNGNNNGNLNTLTQKKASMIHISSAPTLHPAMHAPPPPHMHPHHIQQQQMMAAAAAHAVHHHHPAAAAAAAAAHHHHHQQQHQMWQTRSYESGIGIYSQMSATAATTNFLMDHHHQHHALSQPQSLTPLLSTVPLLPVDAAHGTNGHGLGHTINGNYVADRERQFQTQLQLQQLQQLQLQQPPTAPLQQRQQQQQHHHHHHHHHRHHGRNCMRRPQLASGVADVFACQPPHFATGAAGVGVALEEGNTEREQLPPLTRATRAHARHVSRELQQAVSPHRIRLATRRRRGTDSRVGADSSSCNCMSCYTLAPLFGAVQPARPPRSLSQQQLQMHQRLSGALSTDMLALPPPPTRLPQRNGAGGSCGGVGVVKWCSESDISVLNQRNGCGDDSLYDNSHYARYDSRQELTQQQQRNNDDSFEFDFDLDDFEREVPQRPRRTRQQQVPKRHQLATDRDSRPMPTTKPTQTQQPPKPRLSSGADSGFSNHDNDYGYALGSSAAASQSYYYRLSQLPPAERSHKYVDRKTRLRQLRSPTPPQFPTERNCSERQCGRHDANDNCNSNVDVDADKDTFCAGGGRLLRHKSLSIESFFEQPTEEGTLYMYGGRRRISKVPSTTNIYDRLRKSNDANRMYENSSSSNNNNNKLELLTKRKQSIMNNKQEHSRKVSNCDLPEPMTAAAATKTTIAQEPSLPAPCWRGKKRNAFVVGNKENSQKCSNNNNKNNNTNKNERHNNDNKVTKANSDVANVKKLNNEPQKKQQNLNNATPLGNDKKRQLRNFCKINRDNNKKDINNNSTKTNNNNNNKNNNSNKSNNNNSNNNNSNDNEVTPNRTQLATTIKPPTTTTTQGRKISPTRVEANIPTLRIDSDHLQQQQQERGRSSSRIDISDMESIYGYLKPRKPRSLSLKKIQILDY